MQSSGLYAWFSGLLYIFQFQRQANKYIIQPVGKSAEILADTLNRN